MTSRIHTQDQHNKKETQDLSTTSVQGMFESRSSMIQQKQQENLQQPNLKTSLMQAERYGHHLQHTHPNKQTKTQELPIQQRTLVIGGPVDPQITLNDIANEQHSSHDAYIGEAYKYVNSQEDEKAAKIYGNQYVHHHSANIDYHTTNPPLRIPDKFGGRGERRKSPARIEGDSRGTVKHGPKVNYQPQGIETQYLNNLNQRGREQVPTLHVVAHGTKSGKIGGYKPGELADLLVGMGLQPEQKGNIDLRACRSASTSRRDRLLRRKSPALQLEDELRQRNIKNMNVRGFKKLIDRKQLIENTKSQIRPGVPHSRNQELTANLVDTSQERAKLARRLAHTNN